MVPLDDCREPVFNTPEHQNLYAEVMALPAKYRLPLYLYYYEGYTAAEVGELLGLGPSTVRTRQRKSLPCWVFRRPRFAPGFAGPERN